MFHHPDIHKAPYIVVVFYHLTHIADPNAAVQEHINFLSNCDVMCRVYISQEGINAQMSFIRDDAHKYMDWVRSQDGFHEVHYKLQGATKHVFARRTVKKKPLVAFGRHVSLQHRGKHVSPREWRKMLEEKEEQKIIIDVRNEYEWHVGHFEGSESVPCTTFRDFQEYAKTLKARLDTAPAKVMMCCTGGIRCEYFSALLYEKGVTEVYQLDGGIINYGENEGSAKWKGSLFVFDDRLTVPVGDGSCETIGECRLCQNLVNNFFNCANMDCNELFLCCESCLEKFSGCCSPACVEAPRVRPFQFVHTPFRRWYNYASSKKDLAQLNPRYKEKIEESKLPHMDCGAKSCSGYIAPNLLRDDIVPSDDSITIHCS